jgi:hypothetical protein
VVVDLKATFEAAAAHLGRELITSEMTTEGQGTKALRAKADSDHIEA